MNCPCQEPPIRWIQTSLPSIFLELPPHLAQPPPLPPLPLQLLFPLISLAPQFCWPVLIWPLWWWLLLLVLFVKNFSVKSGCLGYGNTKGVSAAAQRHRICPEPQQAGCPALLAPYTHHDLCRAEGTAGPEQWRLTELGAPGQWEGWDVSHYPTGQIQI